VQGGKEVRSEEFKTHYTPRDEVVCTPETPGATQSPAPTGQAAPAPSATPAGHLSAAGAPGSS
ncbi:hypothetical protein ADK61_30800, partial [Streptomyces sp. XY66]